MADIFDVLNPKPAQNPVVKPPTRPFDAFGVVSEGIRAGTIAKRKPTPVKKPLLAQPVKGTLVDGVLNEGTGGLTNEKGQKIKRNTVTLANGMTLSFDSNRELTPDELQETVNSLGDHPDFLKQEKKIAARRAKADAVPASSRGPSSRAQMARNAFDAEEQRKADIAAGELRPNAQGDTGMDLSPEGVVDSLRRIGGIIPKAADALGLLTQGLADPNVQPDSFDIREGVSEKGRKQMNPAAQVTSAAANVGSYFVPGLGQAQMLTQGINTGGRIAQGEGEKVAKEMVDNLNVFDPKIQPLERGLRAINVLGTLYGGYQVAKGVSKAAKVAKLSSELRINPLRAEQIVDWADAASAKAPKRTAKDMPGREDARGTAAQIALADQPKVRGTRGQTPALADVPIPSRVPPLKPAPALTATTGQTVVPGETKKASPPVTSIDPTVPTLAEIQGGNRAIRKIDDPEYIQGEATEVLKRMRPDDPRLDPKSKFFNKDVHDAVEAKVYNAELDGEGLSTAEMLYEWQKKQPRYGRTALSENEAMYLSDIRPGASQKRIPLKKNKYGKWVSAGRATSYSDIGQGATKDQIQAFFDWYGDQRTTGRSSIDERRFRNLQSTQSVIKGGVKQDTELMGSLDGRSADSAGGNEFGDTWVPTHLLNKYKAQMREAWKVEEEYGQGGLTKGDQRNLELSGPKYKGKTTAPKAPFDSGANLKTPTPKESFTGKANEANVQTGAQRIAGEANAKPESPVSPNPSVSPKSAGDVQTSKGTAGPGVTALDDAHYKQPVIDATPEWRLANRVAEKQYGEWEHGQSMFHASASGESVGQGSISSDLGWEHYQTQRGQSPHGALVLHDGNYAVGVIKYEVSRGVPYVENVDLRTSLRGKGIGVSMYETWLAEMKRQGYDSAELGIISSGDAGRIHSALKRRGYEVNGKMVSTVPKVAEPAPKPVAAPTPKVTAESAGVRSASEPKPATGGTRTRAGKIDATQPTASLDSAIPTAPPQNRGLSGKAEPTRFAASNAASNDLRDALGVDKLDDAGKRKWTEVISSATKTYDGDAIDVRIKDVSRPLTDVETAQAAMRSAELSRKLKAATGENYDELETKLLEHTIALRNAGTEQGRALASRNMAVLEDYSLDGMYRRYVGASKAKSAADIPADVRETIRKLSTEHEALTQRVERLQKGFDEQAAKLAEAERGRMATEIKSRSARKTATKVTREELVSRIKRNQSQYISSVPIQGLIDSADDIKALVRLTLEDGITDLSEVYKAVSAQLKSAGVNLTRGEFDGVLAGAYKKTPGLKKDLTEYQRLLKEAKESGEAKDALIWQRVRRLDERIKAQQYDNLKETSVGKALTDAEIALKAKQVEFDRLKTQARAKAEFEALPKPAKFGVKLLEAGNISRSIIASSDLSALMTQGLFHTLTRPNKSVPAFIQSIRAGMNDATFNAAMGRIRNNRYYDLGRGSKLEVGAAAGEYTDDFMVIGSGIVSKGKYNPIAASERAYRAYVTSIRMDIFEGLAKARERATGGRLSRSEYEDIAEYANTITGTTTNRHIKNSSKLLGSVLFAPKYTAGSIKMAFMTPAINAAKNGNYKLAQSILKDYLKFAGVIGGAILLKNEYGNLARTLNERGGNFNPDQFGGEKEKVNVDPRSGGFMKGRVGGRELDYMPGFGAYYRMIGQTARQQTDKVKSLPKPPNERQPQGLDPIFRTMIENKLAPVPGAAYSVVKGKRFGKSFDLNAWYKDELEKSKNQEGWVNLGLGFLPMLGQTGVEIAQAKMDPKEKAMWALLSVFGVRNKEPYEGN